MSGIQIADAKAPWIMFERRAVEDRAKCIEEGRYVAKDVDFVLVTPHGSKDQIEREVKDWFENMDQQVREQRLDPAWLSAYKQAYSAWKEGKEVPLEGTPIINWPMVSPAQVRMLQDMHILTVEVLANATEEAIKRLGMGGRSLVEKAKEFLKQYKEGGKTTEEIVALRAKAEGLETIIKDQAEKIKAMQAMRQSEVVEAAAAGAGVTTDDLGLGKKF